MKKRILLPLIAAGYGATVLATKAVQPKKRTIKPYFSGRAPYVFAHRGGLKLAPESTMAAFKEAAKYEVDGFEIDIRLTKDDEIVVFHDSYIDRVSNGTGKVVNHTLAELKAMDFGYHFKDVHGDYSYRGHKDAAIVTLKELIEAFPEMRINIDIKDRPETKAGQLVPSLLYRLIDDLNAHDNVLVTSFYDENVKRFKIYGENIATGASKKEVAKAYALYTAGYGNLYQPDVDTFQIPVQYNGVRLDNEGFISFLQNLNVAVSYWVINTVDEMDALLKKGAHGIVTDRPDLSYHLIKEKYKK